MTLVCPREEANSMAVLLSRSGMPRLTSSRCNSEFTTPSRPFLAAHESSVRPYLMAIVLGLISSRANSTFTILLPPHAHSPQPTSVAFDHIQYPQCWD